MNISSPVLDTPGAASYCGIATATLETWRSTGKVKIPFIRVGRRVLYRITDLDAFLSGLQCQTKSAN